MSHDVSIAITTELYTSKSLKVNFTWYVLQLPQFKKDKPKELPEDTSAQNKLAEIKTKFSKGEITEEFPKSACCRRAML